MFSPHTPIHTHVHPNTNMRFALEPFALALRPGRSPWSRVRPYVAPHTFVSPHTRGRSSWSRSPWPLALAVRPGAVSAHVSPHTHLSPHTHGAVRPGAVRFGRSPRPFALGPCPPMCLPTHMCVSPHTHTRGRCSWSCSPWPFALAFRPGAKSAHVSPPTHTCVSQNKRGGSPWSRSPWPFALAFRPGHGEPWNYQQQSTATPNKWRK